MPVFNRISGGAPILDATALPSDVTSGKIFYNNDGRQVGTNATVFGEITTIEKSYTKSSKNVYSGTEEVPDRYMNRYIIHNSGEFQIYDTDFFGQYFSYIEKIPVMGKRLIGVTYDGFDYVARDKVCNNWFAFPKTVLNADYGNSTTQDELAVIYDAIDQIVYIALDSFESDPERVKGIKFISDINFSIILEKL